MLKRLHAIQRGSSQEEDIGVFALGGGRSNLGDSRLGRALTAVTEAAGI